MKEKRTPHNRAGSFGIAMTFLGCLIGAGFLSGQELCQFFGIHGVMMFPTVAISMLAIFLVATVILRLAIDTGEARMDKIVIFFDCKPLRTVVAVFEILFVFMIYLIGISAFGSLLEQMTGLAAPIGSAIFAVTVFVFSLFGIKGLLRFFSFVIPALIFLTVFVAVFAMVRADAFSFPGGEAEGIISGIWPIDGASYGAFALFCILPIFVPLGGSMRKSGMANEKTSIWRGVLLGTVLFTVLTLGILLAIATDAEVAEYAMPMLELATRHHVALGVIYGVLLVLGMLSATLSAAASMSEYFSLTFSSKRSFLIPVMALVSLVAYLLGLFGFRELVSVLFPFFGYAGTLPLALLLVHAFRFYRARKKQGQK